MGGVLEAGQPASSQTSPREEPHLSKDLAKLLFVHFRWQRGLPGTSLFAVSTPGWGATVPEIVVFTIIATGGGN
jgi:hypothetical protein